MAGKGNPGPKKGYKQSPEHIEKRKRYGAEHHGWKGDGACVRAGRTRALRKYPVKPCDCCGESEKLVERHHRDGNTLNNESDNIIFLCRKCHMAEDGRLEKFIELAKQNQPVAVAARWH